jgi:transposase
MSLHPKTDWTIPPTTVDIARAAFPQGNVYMKIRDQLGHLYDDEAFETLFRQDCGQTAYSPGQLALVSILQFSEGLTDRQAADAVRGRIEWKYVLGLEITDSGFHYSVLSEFRSRLLSGGRERQLLDTLLNACSEKGWIKATGKCRTDSTHILAAIRKMNHLECVGETLRHALEALAVLCPDWLLAQVDDDWFERYGSRIEAYRLPKGKSAQAALSLRIGQDGHRLLAAIYAPDAPPFLTQLPAVETLRQIWVQRYALDANQGIRQRLPEESPNHGQLIQSPYDVECRNQTKRQTNWTGYAVHLTETCEAEFPNLIVQVDTTPASTGDAARLAPIQAALKTKQLIPSEHLVDSGYVSADLLVKSKLEGITLVGPMRPDTSWQARDSEGLDLTRFRIDWEAQLVTCPAEKVSRSWIPRLEQDGDAVIEVRFASQDCQGCPLRAHCTRAKTDPRKLKFKPQALHEALTNRRLEQLTPEFKQRYQQRAGVEGTIAQASNKYKMRRSRYIGLARTHLQHVLTATALNFSRLMNWLHQKPSAKTRISHFAALDTSA